MWLAIETRYDCSFELHTGIRYIHEEPKVFANNGIEHQDAANGFQDKGALDLACADRSLPCSTGEGNPVLSLGRED